MLELALANNLFFNKGVVMDRMLPQTAIVFAWRASMELGIKTVAREEVTNGLSDLVNFLKFF
jgi:hypothetical protein